MVSINSSYIASAVAVGVLGGAAYYVYRVTKKSQEIKLPTEWIHAGTLSELYVYPIKSCGPVEMKEAECSILGLRDGWLRDRTLMVVDEKDNFINARNYPPMLRVEPSVRNSILTLKFEEDAIHVNLADVASLSKSRTAYVWKVPVRVYDCGTDAANFFTRVTGRAPGTTKLAYYATDKSRPVRVENKTKVYNFRKNDAGALPDEVSYNLVNEASIDDLNSRMNGSKVLSSNFRPNFLLKGGKAYNEDNWKFVKIGDNIFEVIKPCFRCVLTTINVETGERDVNNEPIATLRSYRLAATPEERALAGTSPRMGLQMALRSGPGGKVSVNDPVYIAYA